MIPWLASMVALAAALLLPTASGAQVLDLDNQKSVFSPKFVREAMPGALGVSLSRGCGLGRTSRVHLVEPQIYRASDTDCVTVLLNDAALPDHPQLPSWVDLQVIRYFESYDGNSVTVRRIGIFRRNRQALPELDEGFTPDRVPIEAFDAAHEYGADDKPVAAADRLLGLSWHGSPDGNDGAPSWDSRDRFRSTNSFAPLVRLRTRSLDNRLTRFQPYSGTTEAPVSWAINRNGAKVIVIKAFSPYASDYGGSFALVFARNGDEVARILNAQVADFCDLICTLRNLF